VLDLLAILNRIGKTSKVAYLMTSMIVPLNITTLAIIFSKIPSSAKNFPPKKH